MRIISTFTEICLRALLNLLLRYNPYRGSLSCIFPRLFPHLGPKETSEVHSSLYVHPSDHLYISLSLCLSVSLSGNTCRFLAIICAACNCMQRILPQATRSNTLSGSIICLSTHTVICRTFEIFVFLLISSEGVQCCDALIITMMPSQLTCIHNSGSTPLFKIYHLVAIYIETHIFVPNLSIYHIFILILMCFVVFYS